jgi:hypothetical protein
MAQSYNRISKWEEDMSTTLKGVSCSSLGILKPLLETWITTNAQIVRAWQGDLPWWYNERASVSVLAGASWLSGGIAFEEYTADKRTGKKRHPIFSGRVDLYLRVKGEQFIAEAKYFWSGATFVNSTTTNTLRERLKEACNDIRMCPPNGQRRLGILFATPYIAKSQESRVDELVGEWIGAMRRVRCSCSAWVFPRESRCVSGQSICPGAAVLIQKV